MKNTKKTQNKTSKTNKEQLTTSNEQIGQQEVQETQELDEMQLRTLKADFAVHIEEVLSESCSSYECVLCDDHEIGILWSFLIDDTISGFIGIEDNEDGLGIPTVTTGLHLKDISDFDRDELLSLLELNSELINACFTVSHIQEKTEEEPEPIFAEEGESIEYNDNEEENEESMKTKEILMIQCKIPLVSFDTNDFTGVIQNLMVQSDMALNQNSEEEE